MAESKMEGPTSAFDSPTFGQNSSMHVDKPVGSMSISPCGRDVVLASRQGLHVIDLDQPYSSPRHLPHHTPWEVADVQWSPFAARDFWVVSTSNQKALVWNLEMRSSHASIEHVLHAHTRAITDINFSAHHPDVLATCAVDSYVHCWDLRHPARPAMTFCDWFAGATQVKWNRQDSHIIASSHDRYLRIWDERKGAYPLRSIGAHDTKIYGVDWNRTRSTGIVTCSLDKTIKFWDYANLEDQPERMIRTWFPVWRARHTPFGWGLLAMPQRGNNDLHLYDRRLCEGQDQDANIQPLRRFDGHQDQVKEFLWRPRGAIVAGIDNREFQLVSWGTDRHLRLHHVDERTLNGIGYVKGQEVRRKLNLTRKDAIYRTFRDEVPESQQNRRLRTVTGITHGHDAGLANKPIGIPSTGMRKAPIPSARGWGEGGFMSSRSWIHGRGPTRKEINPIAWMRGVKIGKREPAQLSRHGSVTGTGLPASTSAFRPFESSESPESLGEEITHVGEKFSRVSFEAVDVQARHAVVSLNGPWGKSSISVYVRAELQFPSDYPEASPMKIRLEKTSAIPEDTMRNTLGELKIIAQSFVSRKKGSLEAILRYLLGERSFEDSLSWPTDDQEPISSSDDDDDELGNLAGVQSQDLEMSSSGLLGHLNANAKIPLPKACGAVWADNGRLVCFFPPKEEQAQSLLGTLTSKDGDRTSRSQRIFEGFGQFHTSSPGPRNKTSTVNTADGTVSDGSEESFTSSSSSSSGSSDIDSTFPDGFRPSLGWRGGPLGLQRSRSTDQSQKSSAATAAFKSSKPKNIISVHNFENFLPGKKSLAEEYTILGDAAIACAHNAKVAAEHGNQDLAAIWAFIKLVLHDQVPLTTMLQPYRKEPILVIARRANGDLRRRDSAIDLSHDETQEQEGEKSMTGRVRWGQHPFGRSWLVEALFKHFEQLADVQMLAMMSCVFSEPRTADVVTRLLVRQAQHISRPLSGKTYESGSSLGTAVDTPIHLNYCLDYFPSEEVAWSLHRPTGSNESTLRSSQNQYEICGSANSSRGVWSSDPATPHSTGTTPPSSHRFSHASSERPHGLTKNLSVSPERRYTRRSNSNVTGALAAALPRSISLAPSVSSSPPTMFSKKGRSPTQSFVGGPPAGAVTWGVTSIFGSGGKLETSPPAYSVSDSDTEMDLGTSKNTGVKISLKNQNLFDIEGYASVPLLSPSQEWRYQAYRNCYAQMLDVWGLPLKKCEILKFNGLTSNHVPSSLQATSHPRKLISIGKKRTEFATAEVSHNLDVRINCLSCGALFSPSKEASNARATCIACGHERRQDMSCSACGKVVRTLYTPCFHCGHVTHISCYREWFTASSNIEWECLTGCGCRCAQHEFVDVEVPVVVQDEHDLGHAVADPGADVDGDSYLQEGWESLGFQSLGRGVGQVMVT